MGQTFSRIHYLHRNPLKSIDYLYIIHQDLHTFGYISLCMDIYFLCMDLNWRHMDMYLICIGYQWIPVLDIWISFGYGLDLFRIYSQAEALPGASPPAGECPAVQAAALGWAGQGGASGQASQPVMVQFHQARVTGLDTMPQCQADSSMMPVPGGQALGIYQL